MKTWRYRHYCPAISCAQSVIAESVTTPLGFNLITTAAATDTLRIRTNSNGGLTVTNNYSATIEGYTGTSRAA